MRLNSEPARPASNAASRRTVIRGALKAAAALTLLGMSAFTPAFAQETTLRLATWTYRVPGLQEWWPGLISAFEEAHPGVKISVQEIAFADFTRGLTTQFIAGSPPDIVHVPLPTVNLPAWAEAGFLEPLDARIAGTDIETMWPQTQASMSWKDTSYGVLMADYGYVMFYNDALLKAAGVGVPTTPEELLAAAAATTKDGKYGFAITDDRSPNFVREALEFVTGMDGEWSKDGKWNWTDPKVVAALDVWRKLATSYAPRGTDSNAKRTVFTNGDIAIVIENPPSWAFVKSTATPEVLANMHVARVPFPTVPGDTSHGLAIPAGLPEDKAALVWDFIQLAASEKWQTEYARLVKSPVVRPGASDVLKTDPDTAVIVDSSASAKLLIGDGAAGVRANFDAFATILADSLQKLLQSDAPTEQLLGELEQALTAKNITP
jgi:multiple sugar transport system substrate-binding protein